MFNGLEIDMLSLGDADCIIVTQWTNFGPQRVLIDGGGRADAPIVREFLRSRNITEFWAVVCTHEHGDHAGGLIKLVQDKSITMHNGWMHNIRQHVSSDGLRRASGGSSSQAEGVKEVLELTDELTRAFASRSLIPQEPFAGSVVAGYPSMTVLGPSLPFYQRVLQKFTPADVPSLTPPSSFYAEALSTIGAAGQSTRYRSLLDLAYTPAQEPIYGLVPTSLLPSPSHGGRLSLLAGVLRNSSVEKNPRTQPFNDTSTIIGVIFNGEKLLFTGDAGSDALDRVPADWRNLMYMQVPHHGSDGNLSQSNIERFRPKFANVSARGDMSHPDKAIVNGLIKVGAQVFSTHKQNPGHLWFCLGTVPARADYGPGVPLKGTAEPVFNLDWLSRMPATG
jgi:beta-lactamase superfamily II metal-dependent hydrolase